MGLIDRWRGWMGAEPLARVDGNGLHELRDINPLSWADFLSYFTYGGIQQALYGGSLVGDSEKIGQGFTALVQDAYKSNGPVFACIMVRMFVYSQARFQWQTLTNGKPGRLFGNRDLRPLEAPWDGGTTGDLLARMEQDASLAGNAFIHRRDQFLYRLRPDWVTLIYDGYPWDIGAKIMGYGYQPGGESGGRDPVILDPATVAHYAPNPDPLSPWRGMSWLLPIVRELEADLSATTHKQALFSKGATPNMVVAFDATVTKELFDAYVKIIQEQHEGPENAYKTLFLGAGAHAEVVGSNLRQLDFKAVQGAGETRIAAAAGVPPVIAGFSEGLEAATYSNYGQARRRFADGTIWPLWANTCGSLQKIVPTAQATRGGARLWVDASDIPFLREDEKDVAEIHSIQASAIKNLVDSGFRPDAVVAAITSGDLGQLDHTGLYSVQLLPAGKQPSPNGNGQAPAPAETPPIPADAG